MAVYEKILFYSKFSSACLPPAQLIQKFKLDVAPISVDSLEVRERLNGEQFSIRNVPTLLISFDDGRRQLYEGPKVMAWLTQYKNQIYRPQNQNPTQPTQDKIPTLLKKGGDIIEELKEEVDDADIDYLDEPNTTTQPQPKLGMMQQKAQDLKSLASQMERQRQETLGYDENKLPLH